MSFTMNDTFDALPDPHTQPAFYEGVGVKRLLAWVVDTVLIGGIAVVIASIPLFLLWFVFPLVFLVVSVIYRIGSIKAFSATPGMRVFNIELRNHQGQRLELARHPIIESTRPSPEVFHILLPEQKLHGSLYV